MVKYYANERNYNAALEFANKFCPELATDIRNKILLEQLKILKFKLELLKGLCMHWKYLY